MLLSHVTLGNRKDPCPVLVEVVIFENYCGNIKQHFGAQSRGGFCIPVTGSSKGGLIDAEILLFFQEAVAEEGAAAFIHRIQMKVALPFQKAQWKRSIDLMFSL